jgi:hypothetical protein
MRVDKIESLQVCYECQKQNVKSGSWAKTFEELEKIGLGFFGVTVRGEMKRTCAIFK